MAGVTYTYTPQMSGQPKSPVNGVVSIPVDCLIGGTNKFGTLSDVLLLGKIPNQALITDWYLNFTTLAETNTLALVLFATEASGTLSVYATLEASITLDELADAIGEGQIAPLLPIEAALSALMRVPVDGPLSARLLKGQSVSGPVTSEGGLGYAAEPDGSVRAILAYDSAAGLWRPKKVFPPVP